MKTTVRSHLTPRLSLVMGLLLLGFFLQSNGEISRTVLAEDPVPSPTPTPDVELERLRRETAISNERATQAENKKKIAEFQKEELEARFPKPSTSPLSGTTTVEGAVIESQIVAYGALKTAAEKIVEAIGEDLKVVTEGRTEHRNLAIFNERDVNLILSYRVAYEQISIIKQGYEGLLVTPAATPSTPPGFARSTAREAFSVAHSFLGAFVDLTALLRTNVDIKGQTFVIDEGPLAAEVFYAARAKNIKGELYYPYVFPIDVYSATDSNFLKHLEDTRKLRVKAEKLFADLVRTINDLDEANAAVKELKLAVENIIPKKTNDVVLQSGNIIKANCPRFNSEVEAIKKKPAGEQAKAMVELIERVRKACRMNRNKLEELLGLANALDQLVKHLEEVNKKYAKAQKDQQDLTAELLKLESELKLGTIANPTDLDEVKEHADEAITRLKAINAQFDSMVAALINAEAGSANPLTNYIRIERLLHKITDKDLWLQLKVINAGGNNRIKTHLIVDIFRGGNRVSHSGGVIAQYHLFNSQGQSIRSGTVAEYTNYKDAKNIGK